MKYLMKYVLIKKEIGDGGEIAQLLRALTAPAENPNSVSSTHIRQCPTAYNSNSRRSYTFFLLLQVRACT